MLFAIRNAARHCIYLGYPKPNFVFKRGTEPGYFLSNQIKLFVYTITWLGVKSLEHGQNNVTKL